MFYTCELAVIVFVYGMRLRRTEHGNHTFATNNLHALQLVYGRQTLLVKVHTVQKSSSNLSIPSTNSVVHSYCWYLHRVHEKLCQERDGPDNLDCQYVTRCHTHEWYHQWDGKAPQILPHQGSRMVVVDDDGTVDKHVAKPCEPTQKKALIKTKIPAVIPAVHAWEVRKTLDVAIKPYVACHESLFRYKQNSHKMGTGERSNLRKDPNGRAVKDFRDDVFVLDAFTDGHGWEQERSKHHTEKRRVPKAPYSKSRKKHIGMEPRQPIPGNHSQDFLAEIHSPSPIYTDKSKVTRTWRAWPEMIAWHIDLRWEKDHHFISTVPRQLIFIQGPKSNHHCNKNQIEEKFDKANFHFGRCLLFIFSIVWFGMQI